MSSNLKYYCERCGLMSPDVDVIRTHDCPKQNNKGLLEARIATLETKTGLLDTEVHILQARIAQLEGDGK